jgi:hypothetical protein
MNNKNNKNNIILADDNRGLRVNRELGVQSFSTYPTVTCYVNVFLDILCTDKSFFVNIGSGIPVFSKWAKVNSATFLLVKSNA